MNVKRIPRELQNINQWVCATVGSKAPMCAFRRSPASAVNPHTWSTFAAAIDAVADGFYEYIGFVFNDNGYVGIDIDEGYAEDGLISPLAVDIISRCKSYTEKSKSGRGFHIVLKGDLPFKGKNNMAGVEIYKAARYFIMTGDVMVYPLICENQEAIDYILETYFPAAPKEAGPPGERIYQPTWPERTGGKIPLIPDYPLIGEGGRNVSLTSLAGQLHTLGYSKKDILEELKICNKAACKPPLNNSELRTICNSVTKYAR